MAAKVTFVNKNDESQSFNVNLFGPEKNRVKLATVLVFFEASLAIMDGGDAMEADEDGLSMNTFVAGGTYTLSLKPQGFVGGEETTLPLKAIEKLFEEAVRKLVPVQNGREVPISEVSSSEWAQVQED